MQFDCYDISLEIVIDDLNIIDFKRDLHFFVVAL